MNKNTTDLIKQLEDSLCSFSRPSQEALEEFEFYGDSFLSLEKKEQDYVITHFKKEWKNDKWISRMISEYQKDLVS
jgi:hypothetical protein